MLKLYYKFKVRQLKKDIERFKNLTGVFSRYEQDKLSDYLIKLGVQKTFCYCPRCNNELIGSKSFVSDEECVTYKCTECDHVSKWYFEAPCPILLEG